MSNESNPIQNLLVEDVNLFSDKASQQLEKDSIKLVKKGLARQRENYLLYHHEGAAIKLSYILKSKVAVENMKIRVYYWPEEEKQDD